MIPFALAALAGILIAANVALPWFTWLALPPVGWWLARRWQRPWLLPLALGLALGGIRLTLAQPDIHDPHFIAAYNDGDAPLRIQGVLIAPPDVRDRYANLRVRVQAVEGAPVHGDLLARIPAVEALSLRHGDRLILRGIPRTPPEDEAFSYRDYLARRGIYAYLAYPQIVVIGHGGGSPVLAAIYAFRARALAVVRQLWPDPEGALLAGILLGEEQGIAPRVQQAFRDTGTAHIIAISGFNITILAGLFMALFGRWWGYRRGALAAGAAILAYTALVGADAAVVRAAIMGLLALFARTIGRRQDVFRTLAFTALVMALLSPWVLWDVGFQLSFAATLGLVLFADPLTAGFVRLVARLLPPPTAERLAGPVGEFFLFTLAAQITTLPVTAYHFRRLSLVALLANPVILPWQPAVMLLGGAAVLLGLAWLPLGKVAALLAWPFTAFTVRAVEWFGAWPVTTVTLGSFGLLQVVLYYGLLLWIVWGLRGERPAGQRRAIPATLMLAGLTALAALTWRAAFAAPDGRLHLYVLDVGSGHALLVQSPSGRFVLIDGGPSALRLTDALGRRLPPLGPGLDWWVIAATREEEVDALPRALDRYPPDAVLWAGMPAASYSARVLRAAFTERAIPVQAAQVGQRLDLGDGVALEVLAVGGRGAVLRLAWGRFTALLPLGMDFDALEALQREPPTPVTAFLLADSGYAPLNPPAWIAALRPRVVLLSVAADDRDGRPAPALLEALHGYPILRTDRHGWLHLSTDGDRLWIEVERASR